MSAAAFYQVFTKSSIPPGVINSITGTDAALGQPLVTNPVNTKVCKRKLENCASQFTRISPELGGHRLQKLTQRRVILHFGQLHLSSSHRSRSTH